MSRRRWLVGLIAVGSITTAVAWLAGPRPATLGEATTGDAALAAAVRAALADPTGYRGLAVALIDDGEVRVAGLGDRGDGAPVDRGTAFEVGSIGKVLTGMLLANLVADGTVHPDDTLQDLLPDHRFDDPDLAATTLAQLASHRSGLASVRFTSVAQAIGMHLRDRAGRDPYGGQDTPWLAASLRTARVRGDEHPVSYSNYGVAVLGYALAQHTGTPFPELLQRRILDPLGLRHTGFHLDGAPPPPQAARGGTGGGRPMAPWQASGYAPAGIGLWSTVEDLATVLSATMAGTAPGADAARPRFDESTHRRVGYGWFTDRIGDQEITWHNGGTGGFRSFFGFDRATGRGVVVLGNTDREVDTLGRHLLAVGVDPPAGSTVKGERADWLAVVATWFLSFAGGLGLLYVATRAVVDRLRLVTNGAWALAAPALAYPIGVWWAVSTWLWAAGVGLSTVALVVSARVWRSAPVVVGRFHRLRWLGTALVTLAALAVVAWVLR